MSVHFFASWKAMWVGVFWNVRRRRAYVLPLPCIGVVVQLHPTPGDAE